MMNFKSLSLISLAVANFALAFPQGNAGGQDVMSHPIWQSLMINTHNSYARTDPAPDGPDYEKGLDQQMDLGIRILELDIFKPTDDHKDGEINHDTVTKTHCSHISGCVEQIRDWSNNNPNHSPIIVFWEIQNDDAGPEVIDWQKKKKRMHNSIKALGHQLDAFRGQGLKTVSYGDANKPMNDLRGKVYNVVFRKKNKHQSIWGAWPKPEEEVDRYMVQKDIFLAGRVMDDAHDEDWKHNVFPATELRFVKQDDAPDTAPANVFVSSAICNDKHRCKKDLNHDHLNKFGAANGLGVSDIFMIDPDVEGKDPYAQEISDNHGLKVMNEIGKSPDKVLLNEERLAPPS